MNKENDMARETSTKAAAFQDVAETIKVANIVGYRGDAEEFYRDLSPGHGSSAVIEWDRGPGVSCHLLVSLGMDWSIGTAGKPGSRMTFNVGWPSTNHDSAVARAAVALYSQVTDLACLLMAQWAGVKIEG
jgi:hypothetical protein